MPNCLHSPNQNLFGLLLSGKKLAVLLPVYFFFRVLEGNSYSFGTIQQENTTHITSIKFHINAGDGGDMTGEYERVFEKSGWSKVVYSSCRPVDCPRADGMQFFI
jgi:hypothetical protein